MVDAASMQAMDERTLAFYAREAEAYVSRGRDVEPARLTIFLSRLPSAAKILELGCGGGQYSALMIAQGFDVTPTDGTAEIAAAATQRLGRPVEVLLFDDIAWRAEFDGVWANACLLHVPRRDLPVVLDRVHTALKPGGIFYASFKAGVQEGRDKFGRYYKYPTTDWLRQAYGNCSWSAIDIEKAIGSGYDKKPTDWLHVFARKQA